MNLQLDGIINLYEQKKNRSPSAIWTEGFYDFTTSTGRTDLFDMTESSLDTYGVDYHGPTPELQTNNDVQVPSIDINLPLACEQYIKTNFNSLENDGNFGVDIYCRLIEYLELNS